jgi:rhamnose transport system substrate-binding protein
MITTAVKSAGREGIAIWSQGLPSLNYDEVMDGTIKGLVLWNPGAMTYIAMAAAKQYIEDGTLPQNGQDYGEYAGAIVVNGDETIAYVPDLMFTPENIDQYKDI